MRVRLINIGSFEEATKRMRRIGVDEAGIRLMLPKQFHYNLELKGLLPAQANIIKQEILSLGGEAAVAAGSVSCRVERTDCILSGTLKQLRGLVKKLRIQPYGLKPLAEKIEEVLRNITVPDTILEGSTKEWNTEEKTLVMGILNVTPDSFSDGGLYLEKEAAIERALEMVEAGADIIDVGGESTRPGAESVPEEEEIRRVVPVVEGLAKKGIAVSVDTTKASVAERALEAGAEFVNDISAMTQDERMAGVVSRYNAGAIIMHMRGTPQTMQTMTEYDDLMGEITGYLAERIEALTQAGIGYRKIAIDPGIGFAKDVAGNLEILKRLGELTTLGRPILVGTSRKSFIGRTLGRDVGERLYGTIATVCAAIMNGAGIVRVHDVDELKDAVTMIDHILRAGGV